MVFSLRTRATGIIETSLGILVVAKENKEFMLPGGGIEPAETGLDAIIREIYEETNLHVILAREIFQIEGDEHKDERYHYKNIHKVFYVITDVNSVPKEKNEINYINYYTKNNLNGILISSETTRIVEMYYLWKESQIKIGVDFIN